MFDETTPENLDAAMRRLPLRYYEVTFANGNCQRLFATQVHMPRREAMGRSDGLVRFYAPVDPDSHMSRAGRLVLAAEWGTGIVQIRDLDAYGTETETTPVERTFWQKLRDALTWDQTVAGES